MQKTTAQWHTDWVSTSPVWGQTNLDLASWYRFPGTEGKLKRMPMVAPSRPACSTYRPGWLDDEHPVPGDPVRTSDVCFANYASSDCNWRTPIRVCACRYAADDGKVTYMYQLPRPPVVYWSDGGPLYCGTSDAMPPPPPPDPPSPPLPPPLPPPSPPLPLSPPSLPWVDGVVRLVGGKSRGEGRVEVYHDGMWGTISDDGWDHAAARVVCRQLGYGDAVSALGSAWFGEGSETQKIWLDNVVCNGKELSLLECAHSAWGDTAQDSHKEDAGVVCAGQPPSFPPPSPPPPSPNPPPPPPDPSPPPVPPYQPSRLPANQCHRSCPQSLDDVMVLAEGLRNVEMQNIRDYTYYWHSSPQSDYTSTKRHFWDHTTLETALWFRIGGDAGTRMPSSVPGDNRCGSQYPGYLRTAHPVVGDPAAPGEVCFYSGSNSCMWSPMRIRVCACTYDGETTTFLYQLYRPPSSHTAYCGTYDPIPEPSPSPS